MAVQNYEFNYKPGDRGAIALVPSEKDPGVNDLLAAWGLGVDTAVLGDEQAETITLSGQGTAALLGISIPVKLPVQILLTDEEMNKGVSVTSRLSAFFYLWGSALTIDEARIKAQGLRVQPLLHSTKHSWTVPFKPREMTTRDLIRGAKSPEGPFPLALLAEGQFADAFQGKKVPAWVPEDLPANAATASKVTTDAKAAPLALKPGKLLLIGAATPFQKQLMQNGGHLNFFLNAMDVLTLGDALIGIRSKGQVSRLLPKVSAPAKVAWRLFVMVLVPALIALLGFGRAYLRRRTKLLYLKSLEVAF